MIAISEIYSRVLFSTGGTVFLACGSLLCCALAGGSPAQDKFDAVRAEIAVEHAAREYERLRPPKPVTVLWCKYGGMSAARDYASERPEHSKVSDKLAREKCLRFYLSRGGVREDLPEVCLQVMATEFQRVYRRFYIQELEKK